jgi:hypothetical protein
MADARMADSRITDAEIADGVARYRVKLAAREMENYLYITIVCWGIFILVSFAAVEKRNRMF